MKRYWWRAPKSVGNPRLRRLRPRSARPESHAAQLRARMPPKLSRRHLRSVNRRIDNIAAAAAKSSAPRAARIIPIYGPLRFGSPIRPHGAPKIRDRGMCAIGYASPPVPRPCAAHAPSSSRPRAWHPRVTLAASPTCLASGK